MKTTSDWFTRLSHEQRKQVLYAMHVARPSLESHPLLHEPFCEALRHLEEDHEQAKRPLVIEAVLTVWDRLMGD